MAALYVRTNKALDINPPGGDSHLTTGGSDWLWAVFAVYTLSFIVYYLLSFKARHDERIFHYIFTIALFVGMVTYFAEASDLGWTAIRTSLHRGRAVSYQIFFTKYILWVVAWPAIIIALGLISGVSWATITFNVFLAWAWVISYLCGAYTTTSYKWGFYAFGTTIWLLLAAQTLWLGRASATRVNSHRDYSLLAGWLNLLWLLYPVAWAVADGGNVISVTKSFVFFGILDILMLPVISFAFLFLARKWDYNNLNLHFTQYGRVAGREGVFPEKGTSAPAAAPAGGQQGVVAA